MHTPCYSLHPPVRCKRPWAVPGPKLFMRICTTNAESRPQTQSKITRQQSLATPPASSHDRIRGESNPHLDRTWRTIGFNGFSGVPNTPHAPTRTCWPKWFKRQGMRQTQTGDPPPQKAHKPHPSACGQSLENNFQ